MLEIIKELVAAVQKAITALRKHKDKSHKTASKYFARLAKTLSQIVKALKAGEIPYGPGNRFKDLLAQAPEKTKGITKLGVQDLEKFFKSLSEAARNASTLDYHWVPDSERARMLRNMDRLVGKLEALSVELEP